MQAKNTPSLDTVYK